MLLDGAALTRTDKSRLLADEIGDCLVGGLRKSLDNALQLEGVVKRDL